MIILPSVVKSKSSAEVSINLRINICKSLQILLDQVQPLKAVMMLSKLQLFLSLCNLTDKLCILFALQSLLSLLKEFNCLIEIYKSLH